MYADLYKVEHICYNLLSNALKYTDEGGNITVKAETSMEWCKFAWKIRGKGIPKEDIKHIFDRFYQVQNSNKEGTGIGLAIVKSFTELQGGTVKVESVYGNGSKFIVTLPIRVANNNVPLAIKPNAMNEELIDNSIVN